MKSALIPSLILALALLVGCGGATASSDGGSNGVPVTDATICAPAHSAWHHANSASASVTKTKASEADVVSLFESAPHLKYEATLNAAGTLWQDSNSTPARVVPDIHALSEACSGVGL